MKHKKRHLLLAGTFSAATFLCAAAFAQAPAGQTAGTASAQAAAQPSGQVRIIDVDWARRQKAKEHGIKLSEVPLLPFKVVGRGMRSGLIAVEDKHLLDKARYYMTERDRGILPMFGGMGIGTGLTLGAKYYVNDFVRPGGELDIIGRVSTLLYREFGAELKMPLTDSRRVFFDAASFYRVRTQDDFYGLGNETTTGGRTSYMTTAVEFLAGPRFQFTPQVSLNTRFGWRRTDADDGKDKAFPKISLVHSPLLTPGLGRSVGMFIGGAAFDHDGRDVPLKPRRGGYHHVSATWFGGNEDFGFTRYLVEAQRFIPLGSRNRTFALRFLGVTNQARENRAVPFYEQFILGGSRTLRGYREFRFYDLSGMVMTGEYRFNLNPWMDLVLFADAGQVAREPGDFSWDGLRAGWGGGVRFLTATSTPFKVMIGRSREGTRIYFSMGSTF